MIAERGYVFVGIISPPRQYVKTLLFEQPSKQPTQPPQHPQHPTQPSQQTPQHPPQNPTQPSQPSQQPSQQPQQHPQHPPQNPTQPSQPSQPSKQPSQQPQQQIILFLSQTCEQNALQHQERQYFSDLSSSAAPDGRTTQQIAATLYGIQVPHDSTTMRHLAHYFLKLQQMAAVHHLLQIYRDATKVSSNHRRRAGDNGFYLTWW
jgi:type IV secretory pathway VirB10-like protein